MSEVESESRGAKAMRELLTHLRTQAALGQLEHARSLGMVEKTYRMLMRNPEQASNSTRRHLAERLGVPVEAVVNCITNGTPIRGVVPAAAKGPRPRLKWDHIDLGKRSDYAIASEVGVTATAVAYQRKKRGIPAFGASSEVAGG